MHFRFSKKWGALDYKVWLSFIIVSVLSLGLFSYKMATRVECPETILSVTGKLAHNSERENTFYVNEAITFNTRLNTAKYSVVWDFGDKTPLQKGVPVTHTYAAPGSFIITATINGVCRETVSVRITEGAFNTAGSSAPVVNPIISGDILKIGNENIFVTSLTSDSYEWKIEELPELGKVTAPSATFVFPRAGNYTVNLVLGDGRSFTKIVQVIDPIGDGGNAAPLPPPTVISGPPPPVSEELPPVKSEALVQKPEEEKPETPAAVAKSYELLPLPAIQAMLEEVIEGKKDVADFNSQLCNGAGTKVMANDKPTTFAGLCLDLKKKRKKLVVFKKEKSITSLKVVRDETNGNCITLMYVNYK